MAFKRLSTLIVLLALLVPSTAHADQNDDVAWDPSWRPFRWYNYALTASFIGGALGIAFGADYQSTGYSEGVLLDDAIRDTFKLETRKGRDVAASIGDRLYQGGLVYPYLVDTLLVAWIAHDAGDVAAQMFLINLQSHSLTALVSLATEKFIGRSRPSTVPCESDPEYEKFCNGGDEDASFISGHTSVVMTSAALVCAHHSKLPLYGGGGADIAACATAVVLGSSTGVLRMINDRHWASDVVAGMAVGALSGYVFPMAVHYGFGDGPLAGEAEVGGVKVQHTVLPIASGAPGLSWAGMF